MSSVSLSALLWSAVFATRWSAATSQTVACTSKDVSVVQFEKDVTNPTAFCTYWTGSWASATDNPLGNLNSTVISQVCSCISAHPTLVATATSTTKRASTTTTSSVIAPTTSCSPKDSNITAVENAFLQPLVFCKYYINGSQTRTKSPVSGVNAQKLSSVCSCATATPSLFIKATVQASSTHQASTTKAVSSAKATSTRSASPTTTTTARTSGKASSSRQATSTSSATRSSSKPSSTRSVSSSTSHSSSKASLTTGTTKSASTTKTASSTKVASSTSSHSSIKAASSSSSRSTTKSATSGKVSTTSHTTSHTTSRTSSHTTSHTSLKAGATTSHTTSHPSSKTGSTTRATTTSSSTKGATTGKSTSHIPTGSPSSHKSASTTGKASLITGSLPATATSQTASAATVSASTNVAAKPAVPSTVNKAALSNLTPSKNATLAFKDSSSSSFSANSNATFKYPSVMLDYSSLISSVVCSTKNSTMTINFTSKSASTSAYTLWTKQSSLVFVTSSSSCSTNGSDYYFLASALSQASTGAVTVKGSTQSLSQVIASYAVKFSTGSSSTTTSSAVKTNTKLSLSGIIAQLQHTINSLSSSTLVTSPWGSQSQLFRYVPSALSIFTNLGFYESLTEYAISDALLDGTIVSPEVSMYCIDCSVDGGLGYSGAYTSSSGSTSLAMTLAGSLDFNFKVGINAFAPLTTTVNIPVGQFALPQVQAGSLLSVQPMVQVSLVGSLTVKGPGQVVLGSQSSWSNVSITLNTNSQLSSIVGTPVVNYPFSVEGPAEGDFSLTAQAAIVLQYSGSNSGSTTKLSFLDARTISGQSSTDSSNCDGIMWSSSYTAVDTALAGSSSATLQSDSGSVNDVCIDQGTGVATTIVTGTAATTTADGMPTTTGTLTDEAWTTATDTWFSDDQTSMTATETWTDAATTTTAETAVETDDSFTYAFTGTGTLAAEGAQQTQGSDDGSDDSGDGNEGNDTGCGNNGSGWNWPWSWGNLNSCDQGRGHGHPGQTTRSTQAPTTTIRTTTNKSVASSTTTTKAGVTTTTTTTMKTTSSTTTTTSSSTTTTSLPTTTTSSSTTTTSSTTTSTAATNTPALAASNRTPAPAGCVPNLYTFLSSDNQLWQLNSTLGYNGDLGTVQAGSIADCIDQCDAYGTNCAGVTWLEYGSSTQYCYLSSSSSVQSPGSLSNYAGYSAVRISGTSCISAQAPSCPGDDGGTYRSSTGFAYDVQCSYQYSGTVLAYADGVTSLQGCLEACDTVGDCDSVSYAYGGSLSSPTCTIFNSTTGAVASSSSLGYSVDSGYLFKF
ncbi:hypothetical protein K461DRAFT_301911 [Myriangium duriaei CBS 260.36]|uniref:DUF7029 domain-containing protein n=1 Tax=Myriangium duriaei CBS 260.36 TaxID=1168546 RepID=A0A9P4IV05_9PEZI|nr:hypothetical protein K461DRAFT_301911 [Myriangium duriaei CBS 260.36]